MVNYRRNFIAGGTYFFTVTLVNRKLSLLLDKINLLKEAVTRVKHEHPFQIKAYVVLPDHLHMIWELPQGDSQYSLRWRKIKTQFSKAAYKSGIKLFKTKHNEYRLWQRRFWEHTIKDTQDFENHINYIHYNPIKHGLVKDLQDWPHSSFHHYVKIGFLSKEWGNVAIADVFDFGE